MSYQTPYPTDLPGLDEARLLAIQARIVEALPDLNAALNRDGQTPLTFTEAQVVLGDPETVTRSLLCVTGGGRHEGLDAEIEGAFLPRSDRSGFRVRFFTPLHVYIGPKDLLTEDPLRYAQTRELALARICDHLRKRVFNSQQGAVLPLASQELTTAPDFDTLNDGHIAQITKGRAAKGPGATLAVYAATLLHVGWIA